jgi:A/G-specific adenine glycosylase
MKLSSLLLRWYSRHRRTMPWRDHPDPYAVWVSEIMLQQTRVETVIPYFERWMKLFPDINALANAKEQDVLNAWEGLGYYTRARNLHKTAKIIASDFNGKLPRDLQALRQLPGVGRYTAGAIASIAFKMDEPTLDGNIRRVLSRLFDVTERADSSAGENILWDLAARNLPKGKAGDYNQALMELGSMICLPKNPRCLLCPLMGFCKARENGTQEARPVLKPKKQVPRYIHAAAVIIQRGRVLLRQRPPDGLLGGMWEFPNVRVGENPAGELEKALKAATKLQVKKEAEFVIINHAYSHFSVTVHAFRCKTIAIPRRKNLRWVKLGELGDFPMGKVDRQIAEKL